MLFKIGLKNNYQDQIKQEKKYAEKIIKQLGKSKVPDFSYGAGDLNFQ